MFKPVIAIEFGLRLAAPNEKPNYRAKIINTINHWQWN